MAAHDPAEHLELDPALIDAIATRLLDPLAERVVAVMKDEGLLPASDPPTQWLDAAEMARRLGVTREWVYEHAGVLGAVRIGDGPRPRLRFPLGEHGARGTGGGRRRRVKPSRSETRRPGGLIPVYDG